MSSCFFIGHREAPIELEPFLQREIERHIVEYGVNAFILGRYGRFDHLAAQAVVEAKEAHPGITLSLLLPYHPAERTIELPKGFDDSIYPDGMETTPRRYAIERSNRQMIRQVNFLIAYVTHPASNASKFLAYAKHLEAAGKIKVTNCGDMVKMANFSNISTCYD